MEAKHLKAACLGAALATAWGAAEANASSDVTFGFNLNASGGSSITHAKLAYSFNGSGEATYGPITLFDSTPVTFSSALEPEAFDKFVLVGLGSPGHVVVSMSSGSPAYGVEFNTVFPGFDEATIASYLENDDPAISGFTSALLDGPHAQEFNNAADAVIFSEGQLLGNIGVDVEAVPEPTGLLLGGVIMGGTGLMARRRR